MDKGKILVSVIVCVYNGQETISKCLDSLIDQTLNDIEIIVVDDGSIDNTLQICEKYSLNNPRIKVYHQSNIGLMKSRRRGVEIATGKYIFFADADDWCEKNMLEKMYNNISKADADIVFCSGYMHSSNSTHIIKNIPVSEGIFLYSEYYYFYFIYLFGYFASDNIEVSGYLWCCLFKAEIVSDFDCFDVGLHEDELIMIQALHKSKKICVIKDILYHYNRVINSSMSRQNSYLEDFWENGKHVIDAKIMLAEKMKLPEEDYLMRCSSVFFHYLLKMIYNETNYMNPRGIIGGYKYVKRELSISRTFVKYRKYINIDDFFRYEKQMIYLFDKKFYLLMYVYYLLKYKRMKKFKVRLEMDQKFQE